MRRFLFAVLLATGLSASTASAYWVPPYLYKMTAATVAIDWKYDAVIDTGDGTEHLYGGEQGSMTRKGTYSGNSPASGSYGATMKGPFTGEYHAVTAGGSSNCSYRFDVGRIAETLTVNVVPQSRGRALVNLRLRIRRLDWRLRAGVPVDPGPVRRLVPVRATERADDHAHAEQRPRPGLRRDRRGVPARVPRRLQPPDGAPAPRAAEGARSRRQTPRRARPRPRSPTPGRSTSPCAAARETAARMGAPPS